MSEPWQDSYRRWIGTPKPSSFPDYRLFDAFEAGWHARDEEIRQLRAIAERGAIDLDAAAEEILLAGPKLDWDTFIGILQRQAQHIRNALAVNVPDSETWKEGMP
jgi:hypothetical protein